MRANEITAEAERRLKGRMTAAASLIFILLLCSCGAALTGNVVAIFFETMLMGESAGFLFSLPDTMGTLSTLLLVLLLASPLQLNAKRWFQAPAGEFRPLRTAFSYFTGTRRYFSALWFSLVRFAATFLSFLLPLLPAVVLAAIIRAKLTYSAEPLGPLYGILIVLCVLFVLLALCYGVYLAMGLFFTDYLYVKNLEGNPFRAIAASFRLMKGSRGMLLQIIGTLLPYLLLCLLVAPLPFCAANVLTSFAVWADEVLGEGREALSGQAAPAATAA